MSGLAQPSAGQSLDFATIGAIGDALQERQTTSAALIERLLDRVARLDADGRIYVALDSDDVLDQARRLDSELAAGRLRGPLHGVPISVKDIYDVAGYTTRCGSPRQVSAPAERDAQVVSLLRDAGALIFGKVATTEFACAGYHPDVLPPLNPWNSDHVPGVSSSGSGVSVAAGLAFGSIGTDTGGSIRMPAAACGIVGLKPTFGAVSRRGVMALSPRLDHCGPLARSVADVETMFAVMRSVDPQDPATLLRPSAEARSLPIAGRMKIGWDEAYATKDVELEVHAALVGARDALAAVGHEIVEVSLAGITDVCTYWKDVIACEAMVHLRRRISAPGEVGPVIADILAHADQVNGIRLAEAEAASTAAMGRLAQTFAAADILLAPTEPFVTPTWTAFPPQLITPPAALAHVLRFAAPYNFTGCPTLAVPFGRTTAGLPLSVQLIAPWGAEKLLFAAGRAIEDANPFAHDHPPEHENVH